VDIADIWSVVKIPSSGLTLMPAQATRAKVIKIFKPELWNLQWTDNKKQLVKIKMLDLKVTYRWSGAIT
jgi:hypothetical protein